MAESVVRKNWGRFGWWVETSLEPWSAWRFLHEWNSSIPYNIYIYIFPIYHIYHYRDYKIYLSIVYSHIFIYLSSPRDFASRENHAMTKQKTPRIWGMWCFFLVCFVGWHIYPEYIPIMSPLCSMISPLTFVPMISPLYHHLYTVYHGDKWYIHHI